MRLSTVLGGSVLAAALPFAVAHPHDNHAARHDQLARRMSGEVSTLHKRAFSGRFTFYDVGL